MEVSESWLKEVELTMNSIMVATDDGGVTERARSIRDFVRALLEQSEPVESALDLLERPFEVDHRDNPGLHKLYVGYAVEDLTIIRKCVNKLFGLSRWPASIIASTLWGLAQEHIKRDAAYFEAAALIYSRLNLLPLFERECLEEGRVKAESEGSSSSKQTKGPGDPERQRGPGRSRPLPPDET